MELTLKSEVTELVTVAVEVDTNATRYHVMLSYDKTRDRHIVTVPNFDMSLDTKYPLECGYKLGEKGMGISDREAVVETIKQLLYPKLQLKLEALV